MNEQALCNQIVESLRKGVPPRRGIDRYSVGNELLLGGVKKYHLCSIANQGIIRFISGSWGAGKTHFFRQLRELAFEGNCLVSNVELDNNNAALNKFEKVFYSIILHVDAPSSLSGENPIEAAPFGIVLREALGYLGSGKRAFGNEISFEEYSKALQTLMSCHGIDIDFKKIIQKYWETYLPNNPEAAILEQMRGEILQWFAGEGTIGNYRKRFGVGKMVSKDNAKLMLGSLSEFVRLAGYQGLIILFDEAEQAYSIMRKSALRDAHNNLLSLINNIESLSGLFLIYATTPDFYTDPKHGIVIYGALSGRIGRPEQRKPKALDTIWNLDCLETRLEDYQLAACKIKTIYGTAFPDAAAKLPSDDDIKGKVAELFRMHPSLSAVRFWRIIVSSTVQHFDDIQEGDQRSTDQLYNDVMESLREV